MYPAAGKHPCSFKKGERLCSRKSIESLFTEGKSFNSYPFRVIWKPDPPADFPARLAIAVPKRFFRKAVDRNLIRRRIREAYRKNKNTLYRFLGSNNSGIIFTLIYIAKTPLTFKEIEEKIILTLRRLQEEHAKSIE